ncbi:hypothetical protein DFH08DRAFT_862558 [Mycena albidolilacea]|uniref:DUF3533 domain-containing protein n=1 Tax=Mycena albidolilacea TaxID=1033008 RepID=A0AAD7A738_9AGAR|nr:hypothetical protein DFH08DRAFT_862558 [Mycena albidolilacea]
MEFSAQSFPDEPPRGARMSPVSLLTEEDSAKDVRPQSIRKQQAPGSVVTISPIPAVEGESPFSVDFLDNSLSAARVIYLKILVAGVTVLGLVVFAVCAIYWGSIWSTPHRSVTGWIVDFDGGFVGEKVVASLFGMNGESRGVEWEVISASRFPEGLSQVKNDIVEEKAWAVVAINPGTSSNLAAALSAVDKSYNSSSAITFVGSEARNEVEYRNVIMPLVSSQLEKTSRAFALEFARNISQTINTTALLSNAPQIITEPISYTIDNVRSFYVPVAGAVTFAGLIYLLILSFFMVLLSNGARLASGLEQRLTLGSLIRVRLVTCFVGYFFVALFYTLLSVAFQLSFNIRFGKAGIIIFWMLNWIGMLACGMALEALTTLVTVRLIPLFLIFWIISNMSVSGYPLEVLPHIYKFGYLYPFYNISRGVRTIVLGTKNDLGMNFGILLAWLAISCVTLPLFQWWMRRKIVLVEAQPPAEQKR